MQVNRTLVASGVSLRSMCHQCTTVATRRMPQPVSTGGGNWLSYTHRSIFLIFTLKGALLTSGNMATSFPMNKSRVTMLTSLPQC